MMKSDLFYSPCTLCGGKTEPYHRDQFREYYFCPTCHLVHVPAQYHLTAEDEKGLYDLHQNSCHDAGYLHFLGRLTTPLLQRLGKRRSGLDFGCGPGPALGVLLEKHGHSLELYDPFYFPNRAPLSKEYDFVCATEVVEHFKRPGDEFRLLFKMLKRDGWLAIMTKMVRDQQAFRSWHYIRDPTHIAFYHEKTFEWIAAGHGAKLEVLGEDVVLLQVKSKEQ